MPTPIVQNISKDATIFWQQHEDGVPEPALIVTEYADCIEIAQDGRYVNLNWDTVAKLCSHLKSLAPPE